MNNHGVVAHLELPADGNLSALRIYVRSESGTDLTHQQILDAVSDILMDHIMFCEEGDEPEVVYDA